MGTRIRHLEFYGFPDQNVFSSLGNVDLSDIHKTNQEQDEEISELSGKTSEKADLTIVNELSAKTDAFIERQGEINSNLADSISGNTERIAALEATDTEVVSKLNELVTTLNETNEDLDKLDSGLTELSATVVAHIEEGDGRLDSLSGEVETLKCELDGKADKSYVDENFALKGDYYTKEESDDRFLREHQDISHLATKEEVGAIEDRVEVLEAIDHTAFATKDEVAEVNGELDAYKEANDERATRAEEAISSAVERISSLEGTVDTLSAKTASVERSLAETNEELARKVSKTVFDNYKSEMDDVIDSINRTKATKNEVSAVSESVDSLRAELEQEKLDRANGDSAANARVDELSATSASIDGRVTALEGKDSELEDMIAQEVADRKAADTALIGKSTDTYSDDTIWGAKRYADKQRATAVAQAKDYTDDKFSTIETTLANEIDGIKTELSGKADKVYVDGAIDDKVNELSQDLNNKIELEHDRAVAKENNLQAEINSIREDMYSGGSADIKAIYKRINVITTYSGDTPADYTDEGNGVLDVLHREFHDLKESIGQPGDFGRVTTNDNEAVFGTYNISNTGDEPSERTRFSIGIGTSDDDRKNAVEVRENGDIYLWIEGEFMKINDLLAMLAHETY